MIVLYQAQRSSLFIIIILLYCIMNGVQHWRLQINLSVHGCVPRWRFLSTIVVILLGVYTICVRSCCEDVASAIHADHLLVFVGNIFITFNKKLENIVLIMGCIVKHSTRMTYFYWSTHDVFAIHTSHIILVYLVLYLPFGLLFACACACVCLYAHYDLYEHVWRFS